MLPNFIVCLLYSITLQKTDRLIRKTMMRYVILTYVLVFRDISEQLRRRFPSYNHLVSILTPAVFLLQTTIHWLLLHFKRHYAYDKLTRDRHEYHWANFEAGMSCAIND